MFRSLCSRCSSSGTTSLGVAFTPDKMVTIFVSFFFAVRGGRPTLRFLFLDATTPAPTIDADPALAALAALRRLALQFSMVAFASCFVIVDAAGEPSMIFSTEIGEPVVGPLKLIGSPQ
jgi:hypothetical protein